MTQPVESSVDVNSRPMMPDEDALHYSWTLTETTDRGRRRTRVLRWKMTQAHALEWSAANPGKILELVPGSGENRRCTGEVVLMQSGGIMRTPGFGDQ